MIYARQAIVTKYHGPANSRGSRVSAKCLAGRIMAPWNHALNVDQNHAAAALALIRKLGWDQPSYAGAWTFGALPAGGYVATFAPADGECTILTTTKGE